MDLFPTNILDNVQIIKSFTADLPADFTGGLVNIVTKEFPSKKSPAISISLGYNQPCISIQIINHIKEVQQTF